MNTTVSEPHPPPSGRVLIWDAPVRLFHWLLAICFFGAWITSENEGQLLLHLLFGYSLFGLIGFRLLWGLLGSRYARFSQFFYGPGATWGYLRAMLQRRPSHYLGHNPAGAVAIWLMLSLGMALSVSGWLMAAGSAGESLEDVHEALFNVMLAVVIVHIIGVLVSSILHRENLPRGMLTGYKMGDPVHDGIAGSSLAVALAMLVALGGWWSYGLSRQSLPWGLDASVREEIAEHQLGTGMPGRGEYEEHERRERNDDD